MNRENIETISEVQENENMNTYLKRSIIEHLTNRLNGNK